MLQLKTDSLDMGRISKLLVRHNVKASITNQSIILEGNISQDLITQICGNVEINTVQNFISEREVSTRESEYFEPKHNLIYPQVKRGEVYWADLGVPYGSEQGGLRPVIVVSSNHSNMNVLYPTVVVIPCTTTIKNYPTNLIFKFSPENMIQYSPNILHDKMSCAMAEKIKNISKSRLRNFIGIMNSQFMEEIKGILNTTLELVPIEEED